MRIQLLILGFKGLNKNEINYEAFRRPKRTTWHYHQCKLSLKYNHSEYFFFVVLCFYSMGAPVMVEPEGQTEPLQIAMKELK